ncbi:hypothetical protein R1flu_008187 [Riccia fluitans]|uniref:Uncharacterized protein n=1 Tax=Riccia fluitans TaxID=41844 RepID=A0ABD1YEI7_9MARC
MLAGFDPRLQTATNVHFNVELKRESPELGTLRDLQLAFNQSAPEVLESVFCTLPELTLPTRAIRRAPSIRVGSVLSWRRWSMPGNDIEFDFKIFPAAQ